MRTSLSKWGNSLAVRVPRDVAESVGLREGAALEMTVEADSIVLRPRRYDIGDLVSAIKAREAPTLELDDGPRGTEAW